MPTGKAGAFPVVLGTLRCFARGQIGELDRVLEDFEEIPSGIVGMTCWIDAEHVRIPRDPEPFILHGLGVHPRIREHEHVRVWMPALAPVGDFIAPDNAESLGPFSFDAIARVSQSAPGENRSNGLSDGRDARQGLDRFYRDGHEKQP